ncbi:MAG: hypothetical protein KAT85_03145, partial [candidate division Zixibacteria bacterium]|nr:hypothetical protein [candidate division Zixibacteria bacterium]
GFDNPHPSVWGDWRTTADPPGSCDPYAGVVDSSENHTSDPDGYGYRVHVHATAPPMDYGDVPDGPYPTLLANAGARHVIVPGIHLGHLIDPEADGQPSADALGDDKNPLALGDDEDGVVFTTLVVQGQAATVKVTASIGGAYLNAWADWNADGDWDDYAEQIFTNQVLNAGANYLTVIVPSDAHIGTTYSRFRFSTIPGLDYTGLTDDGEVEDYRLFILRPIEDAKMHWPQWPDLDNTGMDVDMFWFKLADDFRCTECGPITDIHFWGSFADDILPPGGPGPGSLTFQLEIYSNIPAEENPDGYWSKPGTLLCEWIFGPGTYYVSQICDNNPEDWFDPFAWMWINDNHFNAYQYDFYIEDDVCYQEKDTIYWLAIKDLSDVPSEYHFGWKTTEFELRFMDDAAALADPPTFWWPLKYPFNYQPEEWADSSLDLAFVITGGEEWVCGDA